MRRVSPLTTAALVAVLAMPLAGCFFSREIAHTRRDIEKAYPDLRLEKQVVVNLGPMSLSMLGWMAGLPGDPEVDQARRYLRDVRRIKVGVFRTEHPGDLEKLDVGRFGFEKDWEVAVRAKRDDGGVWVLYKENPETVEDLYVVVLGEEDLVVARLRGKLDRVLARVMEEHAELDAWVDGEL